MEQSGYIIQGITLIGSSYGLSKPLSVRFREGIPAYSQVVPSFHRIFIVLKIGENLNSSAACNYAFLLPTGTLSRESLSSPEMTPLQVACRREGG